MLLVLQYDDTIQLAVFCAGLITSDWEQIGHCKISLSGLNFDTVWENIVKQVGGICIQGDNSLTQQIEVDEVRTKLKERMDALEKKCRIEKQPTRKLEMYEQMKRIEKELDYKK
ncbi:MAG: DUF4391 domain-containing protein [Bacteroidales bacterium]|nr:DUF4391 domain-containing protein [Bacteroidales bacterium]MCI2146071.1 DUF4391 domain-containing protein [Bacteroidales bacterium]